MEKDLSYDLFDKIIKITSLFPMIEKGDSVLVGFSGGKDSVVLLHSLNKLSSLLGISVHALHINHGIRGQEADRDEEFCRRFCKKYNIPFYVSHVDAVGYSKENKIGLEEGARELRYSEFAKISKQYGITKIATAHTSSDNLETVLFNLIRGASAEGMRGIPPIRDNIIRPLMLCSSDDILEYAELNNLDFVTDSTNKDTDYSRNNIRHNVIPHLKKINPNAENAISNMCFCVMQDVDYLSRETEKYKNTDSPEELSHIHNAILGRVLIEKYLDVSKGQTLSHIHVEEMCNLLRRYVKLGLSEEKRIALPSKIDFVITPARVYFIKRTEKRVLQKHLLSLGLNKFPETDSAILICSEESDLKNVLSQNVYKKSIHTIVKKSVLTDKIFVRCRNQGDLFKFSNMTKKVKKMFNESKVPLCIRDELPVFCDVNGIFWIPGFPLRDDLKPDNSSENLHIYYLTQE